MKRIRRKNGSLTCRLLHRWRYWYKATRMSSGKVQRVTVCQRCLSWYPLGEAVSVPSGHIEVDSTHSA